MILSDDDIDRLYLDPVTRRFNSQKSSRDRGEELRRFKNHVWLNPPVRSVIGKDVKGAADNSDLVTIDDHSLTHKDGTL